MNIWQRIIGALTPTPYSKEQRLRTTIHRLPQPTRPAPPMPECKPLATESIESLMLAELKAIRAALEVPRSVTHNSFEVKDATANQSQIAPAAARGIDRVRRNA